MTTIRQLQVLPIHIRRMIYQYDPSSRMSFKVVLQELKTTSVKRIRNKRKMLELCAKTLDHEIHTLEMLSFKSRVNRSKSSSEIAEIARIILEKQHQRRYAIYTLVDFIKYNKS